MIAVIDTETTGFNEPVEAMEFAMVPVWYGRAKRAGPWEVNYNAGWSAFCDVAGPIELDAIGTHHITKAMVSGEPMLETLLKNTALEQMEYVVAHNAAYDGPIVDRAMGRSLRWICTWRCASHLYPDAPSHRNQTLRYYLDLPGPRSTLPPHRALPDAEVTAQLLCRMLNDGKTPDQLHELTGQPILMQKFRFGKHAGVPVAQVPRDYLQWMLRQDFDEDVLYTCRYYLGMA